MISMATTGKAVAIPPTLPATDKPAPAKSPFANCVTAIAPPTNQLIPGTALPAKPASFFGATVSIADVTAALLTAFVAAFVVAFVAASAPS